jgi:hypothetical protein
VEEAEEGNGLDAVEYGTNKLHNVHLGNENGIAADKHTGYTPRAQVQDEGHNTQRTSVRGVEEDKQDKDSDRREAEDKLRMGPHKHRAEDMDPVDTPAVGDRQPIEGSFLRLAQPID